MEIQVVDLNGKIITVTNLNGAIEFAKCCMGYSHVDTAYKELDRARNAYWSDLYTKLSEIKKHDKQFKNKKNQKQWKP